MTVLSKIYLTLPLSQKKIINQIINEQSKETPNEDILKKAKHACLKTNDEKFIFAYACCCNNVNYIKEAIDFLLSQNAVKWALPCCKEALCTLNNKNYCRDALIKTGDSKAVLEFAKNFHHDDKILEFLMEPKNVNSFIYVLEYAKHVKCANMAKIKFFIYENTDSTTQIYRERFEQICKNKIKKSTSLEQSLLIMGEQIEK